MRYVMLVLWFVCAAAQAAVFNPEVTQENLKTTVCDSVWVGAARPSARYIQKWKARVGAESGLIADHTAPICVGGSTTDYGNLQLQPKAESYRKDVMERAVCRLLCVGRLTLTEAQGMFWQ